jgi:hypothetical protein
VHTTWLPDTKQKQNWQGEHNFGCGKVAVFDVAVLIGFRWRLLYKPNTQMASQTPLSNFNANWSVFNHVNAHSYLPAVVFWVIKFDGYSGPETPAWEDINPSWVPIVPAIAQWETKAWKALTHTQLPLMLAWGTVPFWLGVQSCVTAKKTDQFKIHHKLKDNFSTFLESKVPKSWTPGQNGTVSQYIKVRAWH